MKQHHKSHPLLTDTARHQFTNEKYPPFKETMMIQAEAVVEEDAVVETVAAEMAAVPIHQINGKILCPNAESYSLILMPKSRKCWITLLVKDKKQLLLLPYNYAVFPLVVIWLRTERL